MYKKYFFILIILVFICGSVNSQIPEKVKKCSISAGMGVSLTNTPSFNNYLEEYIPYTSKDSIKSFSVGFEVFGGLEYTVNKKYSVKLDYSYFTKILTYQYSYNKYDFTIHTHQPYIMGYYVSSGTNYRFKYGVGAGYHFAYLNRTISNTNEVNFKASGPSFRGELIFSADLSKSLASYLGGFVTWSIIGKLKDSNGYILKNTTTGEEVNLSGYGVGARLGFSIKF